MPVVTLYLNRLENLIGKKINRRKLIETLPFLGLDIEEQTDDYIKVEYSPNRPDYGIDVGIASGLQGLLGVKKGMQELDVKKQKNPKFLIKTDSTVRKIRPYISGLIAKGGELDDEAIKQLIALQEDLHFGIGRRRKKSSIGIHNLDVVSFPLKYTTVGKDHKFIPLSTNETMTIYDILNKSDVGKEYSAILGNTSKVPIILDSTGNTISFPPIINSALTSISTTTTNLLIEVTGSEKNTVDDTLSIVASALQNLGFTLYSLKINSNHSSEVFKTKSILLDPSIVNQILGLNLNPLTICSALQKCRLDAIIRNKKIICTIPRFRFDIFGAMDLVEEVVLGYGIQNLSPTLPASISVGQKNPTTQRLDTLSQIMIGLGFTEALNSSLTSKKIQYDNTNTDSSNLIEVAESKSQEHTILRNSLLGGLLENLSRNIHESYPQKLFESGIVFSEDLPIKESLNLACLTSHKDVSFTEIKSVLQSLLKTYSNMECITKTATNPMFAKGKTADIVINDKRAGVIGEIDSKVIENFKIRTPVCGFEISLSGFVF